MHTVRYTEFSPERRFRAWGGHLFAQFDRTCSVRILGCGSLIAAPGVVS
jgi:hypothetical protein